MLGKILVIDLELGNNISFSHFEISLLSIYRSRCIQDTFAGSRNGHLGLHSTEGCMYAEANCDFDHATSTFRQLTINA